LLPARNTALRRGIDEWLAKEDPQLRVIAEFDDTALMKVFGQAAPAVFPAPAVVESDICRFYGVRVVGRTSAVRDRYHAISVETEIETSCSGGHHEHRPRGRVQVRAAAIRAASTWTRPWSRSR